MATPTLRPILIEERDPPIAPPALNP